MRHGHDILGTQKKAKGYLSSCSCLPPVITRDVFRVPFRAHPGRLRHSAPLPPGEPEGPLRRHGVSKFVEGSLHKRLPPYSLTREVSMFDPSPQWLWHVVAPLDFPSILSAPTSTFMPCLVSWGNTFLPWGLPCRVEEAIQFVCKESLAIWEIP